MREREGDVELWLRGSEEGMEIRVVSESEEGREWDIEVRSE